MQAWQALRSSAAESRFEALLDHSNPARRARGGDRAAAARWERAKSGDGQVVLLSGSRASESRAWPSLCRKSCRTSRTRGAPFCSPHHSENALHPIISQLRRAAGLERDDTPEISLKKLGTLLAPIAPSGEEMGFSLHCCRSPHPTTSRTTSRHSAGGKTFEALLRQLDFSARRQGMLIVYEDVHRIDPTARDLLDLTIERIRGLPVLLIVTFRPSSTPGSANRTSRWWC